MDTQASADTSRTRSKNKNQHPGAVQVAAKRKRRTKAQIAADNAAQEAKKMEKGRKVDEQIKNIASLEGEMARKDADANGAHPRSRNGDVHILVICPDANATFMVETDIESDDDAMPVDVRPKPKAKLAEKPRPRPVAKNSQRKAKVPNVADQRDLTTDKPIDKESSTQKSNHIRKFLFFFLAVVELASFRSRR
jgi:hypothetical protein